MHCEQGVTPDDGAAWWDSLIRVMVSVELIGATIEISFTAAPPSPPPYRIDNRTPYVFVARQRGAEQRAHVVQPLSKSPFAWAESSLEHVMLVSLSPSTSRYFRSSFIVRKQRRRLARSRLAAVMAENGRYGCWKQQGWW